MSQALGQVLQHLFQRHRHLPLETAQLLRPLLALAWPAQPALRPGGGAAWGAAVSRPAMAVESLDTCPPSGPAVFGPAAPRAGAPAGRCWRTTQRRARRSPRSTPTPPPPNRTDGAGSPRSSAAPPAPACRYGPAPPSPETPRQPSPILQWPAPPASAVRQQLSTSTPPVRRADAPGEARTRGAAPRFALSQRTRKMLVVPRLVRRFGEVPQTQRREFRPLREKRCVARKVDHLGGPTPPFISGPPLGRHRRDPQRRESSIIPAPAEATVAFNGGPIASASLTPVAQLRTRRLVALGWPHEKEFPPATLIDKHDRSLDRDQGPGTPRPPPRSPADGDRTPPSASAALEGWRPPLKFLGPWHIPPNGYSAVGAKDART